MKKLSCLIAVLLVFGIVSYAQMMGCNPGTTQCADEINYQVCNERAIWGPAEPCGEDELCSDGKCRARLGCSPGTRECVDSASYRVCGSYAVWNPIESCASGQYCSNGYCHSPQPQCSRGETRCSPSDPKEVQTCNSQQQWQDWKYCNRGCKAGYCTVCSPGERRCDGSHSYQACDSDGQWGSSKTCSRNYVCDEGSCEPSPYDDCSSVGAYRCSPHDPTTLQRCNGNYEWMDYLDCPLGCSSAACMSCSPGDKKCQDGASYVLCTADGQWSGPQSCTGGYYCSAGKCLAQPGTQCSIVGAKRCSPDDANMLQQCDADKVYVDYMQCPSGCISNACTECAPGTRVCAGATTYRACSSNGQLSDPQSCGAGYTCENNGQCVATPQCSEGQTNCVANSIYSCVSNNWQLVYHCPTSTDCEEKGGSAVCVPEQQPPAPPKGSDTISMSEPVALLFVGATIAIALVAVYLFFIRRPKEG